MGFILYILLNIIRLYTYLLVAYALLSWFPGAYHTRFGRWVRQLVEPLIKPFRSFPLQFAGMDFTILVVILALNFLSRILIQIFI
ncbi:YggT family protein [Streptococcus hongkongensis]|nr:membrane protein [Streptococcus uberis]